ncbi:MAG TPA: tetratricopeptide repeat protein [Candidatus Eisenbacteria bacterium]|nr:tetratricopeptide repeat protein [Candidatus Eisenbacteria bacterium]
MIGGTVEESGPKVQAFGGVAGRVLQGTLSVGPLFSGFVVITSLGLLGYVLREGNARNAFLIVSQLSVVMVLSRFARNGLAGEWDGTIFSSQGGSWQDTTAVAFRYLVLNLVWLLPVLLLGWRPEAIMEAIGQVIMGGGATKLLALTAVFFTLTALTPPVFLIVSVGANRFADIADQRHWRRLFAGRGGDLFLVYALYLGALGMVFCLSLPLFALLAGHKDILTFTGFFFLSFAAGMSLDLLGRLCGFFAGVEPEEETVESPSPVQETGADGRPVLRLVTSTPQPEAPRAEARKVTAIDEAKASAPALKVLTAGKPPLLDARERLDDLERRLAIDPEGVMNTLQEMRDGYAPHPLVLHRLCITLAQQGKKVDSLELAREALPLCLERGAVRLASEIFGAHLDYQDVFGLTRETVLLLAQDLRRHGDLTAAETAFESIVERDRGERRAVKGLLQVAEDHLVRGDYLEAQRLFRSLLERCGDSPLAMHMQDGLAEAERRIAKAS